MKTILTTNWNDNYKVVADLEMNPPPLVGDEVMVLDGEKSACWKVLGRRWCPPHSDTDYRQSYLVLHVEVIEGTQRTKPHP